MYMYVPDIYHYYVILCNTKICVIYKEHVRRNNVCVPYTRTYLNYFRKKKKENSSNTCFQYVLLNTRRYYKRFFFFR